MESIGRAICVMAKDGGLTLQDWFPPADAPAITARWDELLSIYPKGEGYRMYEGVAYSWQDFCQRYPYLFAPLSEREPPKGEGEKGVV